MKNLCLIRFGNAPDPELTLILTLLSKDAFTIARTNGLIMTKFKTELSIEDCKNELAICGHAFILIDMTEQSEYVQVFANEEITWELLDVKEPVMVQSAEDREKDIFYKIRTQGESSLTPEEHAFMQNRF